MKKIWPFFRTLIFIVVGLFNTVLIRPEYIGSWKNYTGYFFLALAVFDIAAFIWGRLKLGRKQEKE